MKKHSLQSAILAVALMLGTSATMTVGHSLVAPTAAQAGILGKVGGAVKGAAKSVGSAAKTVGKGAVHAGKGIGRDVKRVAVTAGKAAVQSPVGKGLARAGSVVRRKI